MPYSDVPNNSKCDYCGKRLGVVYFWTFEMPGAYCTRACRNEARIAQRVEAAADLAYDIYKEMEEES